MKSIDDIIAEVNSSAHQAQKDACDSTNTPNDWVAYITAYAGRATSCSKNNGEEFRQMMIKTAAICVSAINAYDNGVLPKQD